MATRRGPLQELYDDIQTKVEKGLPKGTHPDIKCKKCGTGYQVRSTHLGVRDKDEINCQVCGDLLMKWNGADTYTAWRIGPMPARKIPAKRTAAKKTAPKRK